ncbi:hypothetical protein JET18_21640 [Chryseobacterium sp. L7]|uniref:SMI1/KNR4 family protein n=1 Tax=Chryseobacterium endalhagicum TaxID=2797638 RepID=A0ABS1QLL2_9FLAO|nr:hypothetical protein [Chryseobacterium endalhagicum]MBL1223456.1 hypothetical protein [Chryseobacterium endalhagicum]
MKLTNVIEICPIKYSKEGYGLPDNSDIPDSEIWYKEWQKSVFSLNSNFNPIDKDSYLFDIEVIDDNNLEIILQGFQFDEFENIGSFDGGIALIENNKALVLPTCCGDIGNIKEWKKILENKTEEWDELWIGHPWIFYKKVNGKVQLSDYSDESLKDLINIQPVLEIDELELKIELEKAEKQLINFKNRISKILEKMEVKKFDKISEMLTGLYKTT